MMHQEDHELGLGTYGDVFLGDDSPFQRSSLNMILPARCGQDSVKEFRKSPQANGW